MKHLPFGQPLSLVEKLAYLNNAELNKAVETVSVFHRMYKNDETLFKDAIIEFFIRYDNFRTQQVEDLKVKVIDLLNKQSI